MFLAVALAADDWVRQRPASDLRAEGVIVPTSLTVHNGMPFRHSAFLALDMSSTHVKHMHYQRQRQPPEPRTVASADKRARPATASDESRARYVAAAKAKLHKLRARIRREHRAASCVSRAGVRQVGSQEDGGKVAATIRGLSF